jgi:hypothetical protein
VYKPKEGYSEGELLEAVEASELFTGNEGMSSPYTLCAGFDKDGDGDFTVFVSGVVTF